MPPSPFLGAEARRTVPTMFLSSTRSGRTRNASVERDEKNENEIKSDGNELLNESKMETNAQIFDLRSNTNKKGSVDGSEGHVTFS